MRSFRAHAARTPRGHALIHPPLPPPRPRMFSAHHSGAPILRRSASCRGRKRARHPRLRAARPRRGALRKTRRGPSSRRAPTRCAARNEAWRQRAMVFARSSTRRRVVSRARRRPSRRRRRRGRAKAQQQPRQQPRQRGGRSAPPPCRCSPPPSRPSTSTVRGAHRCTRSPCEGRCRLITATKRFARERAHA